MLSPPRWGPVSRPGPGPDRRSPRPPRRKETCGRGRGRGPETTPQQGRRVGAGRHLRPSVRRRLELRQEPLDRLLELLLQGGAELPLLQQRVAHVRPLLAHVAQEL